MFNCLKKKAVAKPMLTPGMKSGSKMIIRIKRGTLSSRTAIVASSPSRGVTKAVIMPRIRVVLVDVISKDWLQRSVYQRSVKSFRENETPLPLRENRMGGIKGK